MKYIYNGPASGVTLRFGEVLQEILLFPEQEVEMPADHEEMPADHEYTQTLEMLGYLTPGRRWKTRPSTMYRRSPFPNRQPPHRTRLTKAKNRQVRRNVMNTSHPVE